MAPTSWLESLKRSSKYSKFRTNPRICPEYKYIFVHIPKTAGNSIKSQLKSLPRQKNCRIQNVEIRKHAKAREIKKILGDEIWNDYFTFSFVRNPWDLMVSSYHWWSHSGHRFSRTKKLFEEVNRLDNFQCFMNSRFGTSLINEYSGEIFDWISEDDRIIVDFVGRFETINEDWKIVCQRLGIQYHSLPNENKSRRLNYQKYYDRETKDLVAQRFYRTIEYFNYEF